MKEIFKRLKFLLIIPLFFSVTFILLAVIPTSYDVTVPAGVADIDETYDFEGINTSDVDVYSVSVYSYYNISVLTYLLAHLNPFALIEPHLDYIDTSDEYNETSGIIQKNTSLNNSLIAGYRAASKDINAEFLGYIVHSTIGKDPLIHLGDIIVECEGVKLTEEKNIVNVLKEKFGTITIDGGIYLNLTLNHPYNFKVLRDDKEIEISILCYPLNDEGKIFPVLPFNYYHHFKIDNNLSVPRFAITSPNAYGPSAGLMQALFIYDALSGENLTKGLHIVGTGTIDSFGRCGAIGGVTCKVISAFLDKADIFFVPSSNYDEAKASLDRFKTDMELVSVKSLNDCISYLRLYRGDSHE